MSDTTEQERSHRSRLLQALSQQGALILLILMVAGLWLIEPAFRRPTSLLLISLEASFIAIVALGQTLVILSGGIDLSVEANAAFSGILAAILISRFGSPSYLAIPIAILGGTLVGLIQGIIITGLKVNPFIVTFGFLSILGGMSLTMTRGSQINIVSDDFLKALVGFVKMGNVHIPVPLIITLILYGLIWVMLRRTRLGHSVYATDQAETTVHLAGFHINPKILVYGLSGLLAAVSGLLVMGRLQTGSVQNGADYTLISVAAVLIGGTALAGGRGGVWGTLIGVFIMRLVQAGLGSMNVPPDAHKAILGVILVMAVILDVARHREIPWLR